MSTLLQVAQTTQPGGLIYTWQLNQQIPIGEVYHIKYFSPILFTFQIPN